MVPEMAKVVWPLLGGGVVTPSFGFTEPVQPTLHTNAAKRARPNPALPLDTAPLWNCLEDRISLQPFSV
jgi:hypothetical protein